MLGQQKLVLTQSRDAKRLKIKSIISEAILGEASALDEVAKEVPEQSVLLVERILGTTGKLIFSGIGKSGLVAQKLAATFSSLGFASIFLHTCDAMHGDLGVIQPQDFFIGISKSATGVELKSVFAYLKQQESFSALICCGHGYLCLSASLTIRLPFKQEACLLNLAPTSSATAMIAFGDALAIAASSLKKFGKSDFAKYHPAGALGRKLFFKVSNFICSSQEELPLVKINSIFTNVLYTISSKKLGVGIVVSDDNDNRLLGLITDGDLRRACDNFGPAVFDKMASEIMTLNPKTIDKDELALTALEFMEKFSITSLIVTERGNFVVGVVHVHDLIKAGIKG